MTTYYQMKTCVELAEKGFVSISDPFSTPSKELVYGGPIYLMNEEGDIYRVQSNGSLVLVKIGIQSTD